MRWPKTLTRSWCSPTGHRSGTWTGPGSPRPCGLRSSSIPARPSAPTRSNGCGPASADQEALGFGGFQCASDIPGVQLADDVVTARLGGVLDAQADEGQVGGPGTQELLLGGLLRRARAARLIAAPGGERLVGQASRQQHRQLGVLWEEDLPDLAENGGVLRILFVIVPAHSVNGRRSGVEDPGSRPGAPAALDPDPGSPIWFYHDYR